MIKKSQSIDYVFCFLFNSISASVFEQAIPDTGRFGATLFMRVESSASDFNQEYTENMVYEYGLGFHFRMLR